LSERAKAAMTAEEVTDFLTSHRKMTLATIGRDGTPHLVAMYYTVLDGEIAFWTYRTSQKALNMARDPRVTCLVETGDEYFDLQGVQVNGKVRIIEEPAGVLDIGRRIAAGIAGVPADGLEDYVAYTGRKRFGYVVQPTRVSSWDHRKLLT
jgi:PPOX class probable F420-dependent enzyme